IAIIAVVIAFSIPRRDRLMSGGRLRGGVWLLMVPMLVLTGYMLQKEAQLETFNLEKNLDRVETFREYASREQSGVRVTTDLHSPGGIVAALVVGVLHLMLAPFPWQLAGGSVRMLLVGPELLLWWWIFFVGVLPGLRYTVRHRFFDVLPVLFFIV